MAEFHIVESAIRQLHGYFNDAVWRIDAEGVANCFAEDGLWKIAGTQARGHTKSGPCSKGCCPTPNAR